MPPSELEYHALELRIALESERSEHILPELPAGCRRVLDVGCGMGQSLMALRLPAAMDAHGVDVDEEALGAGRRIAPANIAFARAPGETLPYRSGAFDFVFSRVAVPYMAMNAAIPEMARVLRPRGQLWLLLHAPNVLAERVRDSLARRKAKDLVWCGYIALNSALYHLAGVEFALRGKRETVQTARGMRRAFRRAGLRCTEVEQNRFFVMRGVKE
ncbi:MAG: class I SAM-dependent methyltransferase [Gemmatimonadaceae bacterium]